VKNSEALSVVSEDRITCEFVENQYKIPVYTFLFLFFFKSSYSCVLLSHLLSTHWVYQALVGGIEMVRSWRSYHKSYGLIIWSMSIFIFQIDFASRKQFPNTTRSDSKRNYTVQYNTRISISTNFAACVRGLL